MAITKGLLMYRISIIVPIYHVEEFIGRCMDSLFSQECEGAEVECILVNDFTPDKSMDIVTSKLKDYTGNIGFKILHHTENRGLCATRNTGLQAATGDYVLFIDSDDYLVHGAIQYFVMELEEFGKDADIEVVLGNTFSCMDKRTVMDFDDSVLIDNSDEEGLRRLMSRELLHTSWNKLVRRRLFTDGHLYFEEGIIDEDLLWSYQLLLHAKNILVTPRVTYIYENDNPGSITKISGQKVQKTIRSRTLICEKLLSTPPRQIRGEYYTYIYFVMMKAVDLLERNRDSTASLNPGLYRLRNQLLKSAWDSGYYILWLFFLSSVKPFFYITKFWLFRRYFDGIMRMALSLNKKICRRKRKLL